MTPDCAVKLSAIAIGIGFVAAACGEEASPTPIPVPVATTIEMLGPWRPTPLNLAQAMRDRIGEACRTTVDAPLGTIAAVVDARGGGVATVRLTGAKAGACEAMLITADGDAGLVGRGGWGDAEHAAPRPGQLGGITRGKVIGGTFKGNDPPDTIGWSVTGRAGAGIELVTIEWSPDGRKAKRLPLPDCTLTTATLTNGWFSAWCPARGAVTSEFETQPGPLVTTRAYDSLGRLLDETR